MFVKLCRQIVLFWVLGALCVQPVMLRAASDPPTATGSVSKLGMAFSQGWGVMESRVRNPTDNDLDAFLVVGFDKQPDVQFVAPAWIPGHASRQIAVPVRYPAFGGLEKHPALDGQTLLLKHESGGDRQLGREMILIGGASQAFQNTVLTEQADDLLPDWASTMVHEQGNNGSIAYTSVARFDADPTALATTKTLFYAVGKHRLDGGQRAAIRSWLTGGGHLVLLAQRMDMRDGALLLGADWQITEVAREELHSFDIGSGRSAIHIEDMEPPGELIRVTAPGWQTLSTIDGWPAELTRAVGRGTVSMVTCSPEVFYENKKLNDAGRGLASRLQIVAPGGLQEDVAANVGTPIAIQAIAAQMVSYPVVSRNVVILVLASFAMVLTICGVGLSLRHKLEWIAPVGLVAAAGAAGVLMLLGASRQLPLTVAGAQLARVVPSQHAIVLNGEMDIFSPDGRDAAISSTAGGRIWPELKTQQGSLIRLVRSDEGAFHFENMTLPSGAVLKSQVSNVLFTPDTPRVVARFGADGISGTIHSGVLSPLQDVVLHGLNGDMAIKAAGDGTFTLSARDTLSAGSFISGNFLTEVQRQRQDAYRAILPKFRPRVDPVLYGWSEGGEFGTAGVTLAGSPQQRTVTLAAIPMEFERVPAGTTVHIPAALVGFDVVRGAGVTALAYDSIKHQWMTELTSGTHMTVKFTLPASVLPLAVDSATLHVDMRAPGRTVEFLSAGGGDAGLSAVSLTKRENTVSPFDVPLTGPTAPVQSDGSIHVTLDVNSLTGTGDLRSWEIRQLSLEVTGHVSASETAAVSAATKDQ